MQCVRYKLAAEVWNFSVLTIDKIGIDGLKFFNNICELHQERLGSDVTLKGIIFYQICSISLFKTELGITKFRS